jgi:putative endonuclease
MKTYFVYILASQPYGTLYIGFTNDLPRRIYEHQTKLISCFTFKYDVFQLVHVEQFSTASDAISREKQLKKWRRQYKLDLIYKSNPTWLDLSQNLM